MASSETSTVLIVRTFIIFFALCAFVFVLTYRELTRDRREEFLELGLHKCVRMKKRGEYEPDSNDRRALAKKNTGCGIERERGRRTKHRAMREVIEIRTVFPNEQILVYIT